MAGGVRRAVRGSHDALPRTGDQPWSGNEVRWDGHFVDHHRRAWVLGRTAAGSLVDDDPTVLDQLATPDSPGLGSLDRSAHAIIGKCALAADCLGASDVERGVREEQVGQGAVSVGAARLGGANGDRLDEFGELDVDVDVDVSVEVDCVHFDGFLSDEWEGGWKKQKGRRDRIPTASERLLSTYLRYVGRFPRSRAGRLIAVSFMKLRVMSDTA